MALYQEAVEGYVALVEKALPGLNGPMAGEVPADMRTPLFALAEQLAKVVQPRILRPSPEKNFVVGVPLAQVVRDGQPYTMMLRTHGRVGMLAETFLIDGLGPPLEEHLDGFRFTAALSGLLRIVEAEVRGLIESEDFNWDEEWEGEVEHPAEMLKRVRAWRREAEKHLLVYEVHAL